MKHGMGFVLWQDLQATTQPAQVLKLKILLTVGS